MAGLSFRNITRSLENGGGFKGFNLEIDDGEFVAIVGKSGCGKAELLRMAEGYGGSYDGEVYVGSRRVTRFSQGGASLITEAPLVGTPRMEIKALLRREKLSREETEKRIVEAAEGVGAEDILDTRWSKLDAREKLRAGMARAVATGAKAILINDPFTDVDRRTASKMRVDLLDFHSRYHMAFVLATSSGENAMSLASRVIVLDKGEIRQSDTPQNIYDYPADRFVAEYFGREEINMIPADLVTEGEDVFAHFGDNRILVPQGKISRLTDPSYIGKTVLMGVRPENLRYEQAFISVSTDSTVDVTVKHVELKGSETYLHTNLYGVDGDIIARVDPRCIASPGMGMTLGIDPNRLHFFDIKSGESILRRI